MDCRSNAHSDQVAQSLNGVGNLISMQYKKISVKRLTFFSLQLRNMNNSSAMIRSL